MILGVVVQQAPRSLHMLDDRILSWIPTRSEALAAQPGFSDPATTVFAWGDPKIPYVTQMRSGVKWLNTDLFFNSAIVNDQFVDEMMAELAAHPPMYFVEFFGPAAIA